MSGIFANPISEVVTKISPSLRDVIHSSVIDNEKLYHLQEFQQVAGWIKESKTTLSPDEGFSSTMSPNMQNIRPTSPSMIDTDSAFSELANKIAENLMQKIPSYFGDLLLNNIRIQTQGMEKSVKFDLEFALEPIKPYVEFVKKINGAEVLKLKALFQIDSDVKMSDLGFLANTAERAIHLGNLFARLNISLLHFSGFHGTISTNEPKYLYETAFEKDLSEVKLSI